MAMIIKRAADIRTEPLDDVGDGKLNIVDLIGRPEGAPLTAGFVEIWKAAPVEFEYDDDCAVCFMLEGDVILDEAGTLDRLDPGDVVFVPQQSGLKISWHTGSYGKFFFVTYPHWR